MSGNNRSGGVRDVYENVVNIFAILLLCEWAACDLKDSAVSLDPAFQKLPIYTTYRFHWANDALRTVCSLEANIHHPGIKKSVQIILAHVSWEDWVTHPTNWITRILLLIHKMNIWYTTYEKK